MTQIEFGILVPEQQLIELCCFAPDGEGLPWFEYTGVSKALGELTLIATDGKGYGGRCIDTMEYLSPFATVMRTVIEAASPGTDYIGFQKSCWCGTRTWGERVDINYYRNS